jgi:hypothetical protein
MKLYWLFDHIFKQIIEMGLQKSQVVLNNKNNK